MNKNKTIKILTVLSSMMFILVLLYFLASLFNSKAEDNRIKQLENNKEYRASAQQEASKLCERIHGISIDCEKMVLRDTNWGDYDQAKGEVGQYSYNVGNYKIVVFLRANGKVDNSYIEDGTGTTIYEHTQQSTST